MLKFLSSLERRSSISIAATVARKNINSVTFQIADVGVVHAADTSMELGITDCAIAIKLFTIFSSLVVFLHTLQYILSGFLWLGTGDIVLFWAGR